MHRKLQLNRYICYILEGSSIIWTFPSCICHISSDFYSSFVTFHFPLFHGFLHIFFQSFSLSFLLAYKLFTRLSCRNLPYAFWLFHLFIAFHFPLFFYHDFLHIFVPFVFSALLSFLLSYKLSTRWSCLILLELCV